MTKGLHRGSLRKKEVRKRISDDINDQWGNYTHDGMSAYLSREEFMDIARHFYELGERIKEEEWTEKDVEYGSYISAFLQANCGDNETLKEATVWFMSRLKKLPIQKEESEINEGLATYAQGIEDYYDIGEERGYLCVFSGDIKNAVIAGAKWDREQMLKEAVEGKIIFLLNGDVAVNIGDTDEYNLGQKIRVIVLPKED